MKFFKRFLIGLALLLVVGLVLAFVAWRMAWGAPDFYKPHTWTEKERSVLNQQAVNKVARTRQLAQEAHYGAIRARNAAGASTRPAEVRHKPLTITLSQDELNAFLFHNAETFPGLREKYSEYLSDPGIYLRDGQLILAGTAKEIGSVVSVHFEPKIINSQELDLRVAGTYAGRLPLPQAAMGSYIDRLRNALRVRLPGWQKAAKLDANGGVNVPTIQAAMGKMVLNALDGRASDPVIFMPVDEGDTAAALRIIDVKIAGNALTLTMEPMTRQEREELFARIVAPVATGG